MLQSWHETQVRGYELFFKCQKQTRYGNTRQFAFVKVKRTNCS